MGWLRRQRIPYTRALYRASLMCLACFAGLVGLGSTLSALVAVQEIQTNVRAIIEIFHSSEHGATDWTQFGFDASATRDNPSETRIRAATVANLHLMWRATLPENADSAPAYLHALVFPDGSAHNVLYLTTRSGSLVALDADEGNLLWKSAGTMFDPNKPTTASPVADASRGVVYSVGLDGKVHKYHAATGAEVKSGGWPVMITTMPATEKPSSSLNVANGFLYVTTASWGGDAPPFQGHLVVIDLATAATHVFNSLCADHTHLLSPGECHQDGAGIWARPGVVVDPLTGNLFLATGNGPYTADRGGHAWGESVLELTPDGTRLLDAYTPLHPNDLYNQDQDLGSTAPTLLPALPASKTPLLAVQAGKEGSVRLLNRKNLSGQGGPGYLGGELQTLDAPNHCPVLAQPAVWTDPAGGGVWVLVASTCALGGYQVSATANGSATMRLVWTVPVGTTSPMVAGNVLFAATTGNKALLAIDPRSGRQLWTSKDAHVGGSIGYIHWESPIVVNGRLYCTDENGDLVTYGLS